MWEEFKKFYPMLQNLSNNRNRTSILNNIASFSITKGYSMYPLKAHMKYKQPTFLSSWYNVQEMWIPTASFQWACGGFTLLGS